MEQGYSVKTRVEDSKLRAFIDAQTALQAPPMESNSVSTSVKSQTHTSIKLNLFTRMPHQKHG